MRWPLYSRRAVSARAATARKAAVGSRTMASFDAASRGDVSYFQGLTDETIRPQLTQKDEDGRTMLHTAAGAGVRPCFCCRRRSVHEAHAELSLPRRRVARRARGSGGAPVATRRRRERQHLRRRGALQAAGTRSLFSACSCPHARGNLQAPRALRAGRFYAAANSRLVAPLRAGRR